MLKEDPLCAQTAGNSCESLARYVFVSGCKINDYNGEFLLFSIGSRAGLLP